METSFNQPGNGSQTPEETPTGIAPEQSASGNQGAPESAPEITDIGTLDEFVFEGRKYTVDQLRKERMMHQDYTKKTQALSKTTKYWDNLQYDLEKIKARPGLADEFRKVYPKEFHKFLSLVGAISEQAQGQEQSARPQAEIPEQYLNKLSQLENYVRDQEVAKHEARIDATFAKMSKKYPEANEEVVLARAQTLLDQYKDDASFQMTDGIWEKLFRNAHEAEVKRIQSKQKQSLDKQRVANKSANDTSGGGTPGHAPAKMKLKEVSSFAINDMKSRGVRV